MSLLTRTSFPFLLPLLILAALAAGVPDHGMAGPAWAPGELSFEDAPGTGTAEGPPGSEREPDAANSAAEAHPAQACRSVPMEALASSHGGTSATRHPIRGPPSSHL